ncbi:hypothetical protein D0Z00_001561 [Geotrichum galactomycetum]|uniref:Uncharacterized protein n=1 Tax=Geotrichum galactomycetum TaxID=27317 RepID=A0ACB6V6P9_9ASCO|nr:hypothetical protein D0Z00_001561 [Geotrichum candidum]
MGAINIDADLLARASRTKTSVVAQQKLPPKIVRLQNGCVCCTLRVDLLEQLAELARASPPFDYAIVEASGISEPMQVAETFSVEFGQAMADEIDALEGISSIAKEALLRGGLSSIARLDTCATVVDAYNFFATFDTADLLSDRFKDVEEEDERSITDLMVDQIEFASVVIVNKCDLVDDVAQKRIIDVVTKLNPTARILPRCINSTITASNGKKPSSSQKQQKSYQKLGFPLNALIDSRSFDFERAALGAGWLRSLLELTTRTDADGRVRRIPKPETEEYGVSSCLFRARRPFHPRRLWDLLVDKFVIVQDFYEDEEDDKEDDEDEEEINQENSKDSKEKVKKAESSSDEENEPEMKPEEERERDKKKLRTKAEDPLFQGLLRSKGTFWLASRAGSMGEWSQAGGILTVKGGPTWYCDAADEDLPSNDPELLKSVLADFEGEWGDRRQELVFIGEKLHQDAVTTRFGSALLTDAEMKTWEKIMKNYKKKDQQEERDQKLLEAFEDGWEAWPVVIEEFVEVHGH